MGLSLEVGILADLKHNDEEGYGYHARAFERMSTFLEALGLPAHAEPIDCEVWSADMLSYSGLHDVRRLAAYLDAERPLPPPSTRAGASDPLLEAYYAAVDEPSPSFLKRLFGSKPRGRRAFDHLIVHSDAEGYYLPADFADVLFPPHDLQIPGGMIGSVPRLLTELDQIARLLAIPEDLAADSELLWELADSPASDGELWKRYGGESFGCVALREGCRHALATGAALVFT